MATPRRTSRSHPEIVGSRGCGRGSLRGIPGERAGLGPKREDEDPSPLPIVKAPRRRGSTGCFARAAPRGRCPSGHLRSRERRGAAGEAPRPSGSPRARTLVGASLGWIGITLRARQRRAALTSTPDRMGEIAQTCPAFHRPACGCECVRPPVACMHRSRRKGISGGRPYARHWQQELLLVVPSALARAAHGKSSVRGDPRPALHADLARRDPSTLVCRKSTDPEARCTHGVGVARHL